jgi:hypothetical protein
MNREDTKRGPTRGYPGTGTDPSTVSVSSRASPDIAEWDSARRLMALWGRAVRILGTVTVRAIFERAAYTTAEEHPKIHQLDLTGETPRIASICTDTAKASGEEAELALDAFTTNVFALLANLTGETVMTRLFVD